MLFTLEPFSKFILKVLKFSICYPPPRSTGGGSGGVTPGTFNHAPRNPPLLRRKPPRGKPAVAARYKAQRWSVIHCSGLVASVV
ncbi:hypothetical protein JTE90_006515 [Oedothorax gibbosus]|uniref:Uncharacterized protein n=1 Tax=Oedothorax gibbosus TaxID=931172 RepID=A0AAV6THQ9_9ARAC|nr:hypothetical protein JTE90_006515 [Oedothorax gibbosus]